MFKAYLPAFALLAIALLTPAEAATQGVSFSRTIPTPFGITIQVSNSFTVDTTAQTVVGTTTVSVTNSTGAVLLSKTFTISLVFGTSTSIGIAAAVPEGGVILSISCTVVAGTSPAATCAIATPPRQGGKPI